MSLNLAYRPAHSFQPHRLIRHADVQTMLSRYHPRDLLTRREHLVVIDAGEDQTGWDPKGQVRLHGYYTPGLSLFGSRGLVLVLHGWEGCSHSVYNLITTDALVRAGYDVFRLNLRDHGPGFHIDPYALNRGFFMGTLLDEIAAATSQVAAMAGAKPFYIVGASLGGNIALRLALRHASQPIHNLSKVIACNPVLNPRRSAEAIDARPPYLRYFRRLWLRSLRAKQRLYPELFDFTPLARIPSIIAMTEWMIDHYGGRFGDLRSADDYFNGYAIAHDAFRSLTAPTTIITAANDRVVPVDDFFNLEPHPLLTVQIHDNGGHVGYVDLFPLRHNLPRLMMAALREEVRGEKWGCRGEGV
jgi:predicted alpha/beta-fold hydrolase